MKILGNARFFAKMIFGGEFCLNFLFRSVAPGETQNFPEKIYSLNPLR
jgi:hypothetical protein